MTATVPSVPAQPATPGQALRWYADMTAEGIGGTPEGRAWSEQLRRWADELDAAPAVPDANVLDVVLADLSPEAAEVVRRVARERDSLARRCALRFEEAQQLRAERDMLAKAVVHPRRVVDATQLDAAPATWDMPPAPGPEITDLWDREGARWRRVAPQPPYGADWVPWEVLNDEPTVAVEATDWAELVYDAGPLSTAPPAGTEEPTEPTVDHCLNCGSSGIRRGAAIARAHRTTPTEEPTDAA